MLSGYYKKLRITTDVAVPILAGVGRATLVIG